LVIPEPGVLPNVAGGLIQFLKDVHSSVKEYAKRKEIEKVVRDLETSLQEFTSLAREFSRDIGKGKDAEEWLVENVSRIWSVKLEFLPNLQRALEVLPEIKGRTFRDIAEEMSSEVEDEDIQTLLKIIRDMDTKGLDRYLQENINELSAEMLRRMINLYAIVDFLALFIMLGDKGEVDLPDKGKIRGIFRKYLDDLAEFWADVELLREMEKNETGELVSIDEIMARNLSVYYQAG